MGFTAKRPVRIDYVLRPFLILDLWISSGSLLYFRLSVGGCCLDHEMNHQVEAEVCFSFNVSFRPLHTHTFPCIETGISTSMQTLMLIKKTFFKVTFSLASSTSITTKSPSSDKKTSCFLSSSMLCYILLPHTQTHSHFLHESTHTHTHVLSRVCLSALSWCGALGSGSRGCGLESWLKAVIPYSLQSQAGRLSV